MFGDALRRLAAGATYLYQEGPRFWYGTQPTVTKLAEDRAEQLKRDPDKVTEELNERLRTDLRAMGDFSRIHALPSSGADVPDDLDARLVVLQADHAYSKEPCSAAELAARNILETRGNTPRLYRNTLVFLAADKVRLPDLDDALRKFLAWKSIVGEKETLNLDPHQVRQAETQKTAADSAVTARLPETYQWLLVPEQLTPQAPITWQAVRLSAGDALAVRASKRLRSDEFLIATLGSTILRKHLDDVPLWPTGHVAIKQLVQHFARYHYLPRLSGPKVLVQSVRSGLELLTWQSDTFAYAESYDEAAGRYRGLRAGQMVSVSEDDALGLLVKPDIARKQLDSELKIDEPEKTPEDPKEPGDGVKPRDPPPPQPPPQRVGPKRFHGTINLDATRVGRDASRIAEEVIAHLSGLVGANVTVTLEVQAEIPAGAPDHVVRTVTENSMTLGIGGGFEVE